MSVYFSMLNKKLGLYISLLWFLTEFGRSPSKIRLHLSMKLLELAKQQALHLIAHGPAECQVLMQRLHGQCEARSSQSRSLQKPEHGIIFSVVVTTTLIMLQVIAQPIWDFFFGPHVGKYLNNMLTIKYYKTVQLCIGQKNVHATKKSQLRKCWRAQV